MTFTQSNIRRVSVTQEGVVYQGDAGSLTQSATFANICVLPGGRWLCSFRAAFTKGGLAGKQLLMWSDDQGKTWKTPIEPFKPITLHGKPGLIRMAALTSLEGDLLSAVLGWVDYSHPKLPFYNEQTEGLTDMRILLSSSDDAGETWSMPREIKMPGYDCPVPITGPMLLLPDGTWGFSFEVNKHYNDPKPWIHESVMAVSGDRGNTIDHCHIITRDPTQHRVYWDQRLAVLPDGHLLDLFWSFDRQKAIYLNIHARESTDCGKTWSNLWNTGVPGQPAPAYALDDDTLVMVYVDRTLAPKIKARCSCDGGRTWPVETESVIHGRKIDSQTQYKSSMNDAWSEMAAFSIGLPHTASLENNRALVVYYTGDQADHTAIAWAILEPET